MSDEKSYIKTIVFVFVGLGLIIGGMSTAYFLAVGLFYGQSVVEGDVFVGGYKYDCNNTNETASECTNLSTTESNAYQDYATFRTAINGKSTALLTASAIVFNLLGLVFLFLALKSSGIMKGKGSKRDEL